MQQNVILTSALSSQTADDLLRASPATLGDAAFSLAMDGVFEQQVLAGVRRDLQFCSTSHETSHAHVVASLAFVLIAQASDTLTVENRKLISDFFVSSTELRELVASRYELSPDIGIASLRFLDFGTTSIVLRAVSATHGEVAIKLLKPRYWRNSQLLETTENYREKYRKPTYRSPEVYLSHKHAIIMDLVKGDTFERWLRDNKNLANEEYYRRILTIFDGLLDRLDELSSKNPRLSHLDLNPRNIMIARPSPELPEEVWLIDFGTNYALSQNVSAPGQFAALFESVLLYVPPETHEGVSGYAPRADAFSVGMLLAAALIEGELTTESLAALLTDLWKSSPGLAEFVEDLIEREPRHRLVGLPKDTETEMFLVLKERLKNAVDFYLNTELRLLREEPRVQNAWSFLFGIWMGQIANVRFLGASTVKEKNRKTPRDAYFKAWAAVALLCHSAIVILFVLLTLIDISETSHGSWIRSAFALPLNLLAIPFLDVFAEGYRTQTILPVHVGDIWANLPGRLVCLSFSVVACRYYLRIFSVVYANTRNDALCRQAELVMRLNAFSFLIPISVALLVQPKWWPFCVFTGILPVVLNNVLVARLVKRAESEGHDFYSNQLQKKSQFISDFDRWWYQMLLYALVNFVLGVFLLLGALKDEMAYALIVLLLNEVQIVHVIIGGEGFATRAGIKRLLFLDRRIVALNARA